MTREIKIDPEFRDLLGELTPDEYQMLETRLIRDGQDDPIILWNDTIVDGHNRYEILTKYGREPKYKQKEFADREAAMYWMFETQGGRRNISTFRRAELALRFEPQMTREAKERQGTRTDLNIPQNSSGSSTGETRKKVAKLAGTSHDTVRKVKEILDKGTPEQIKRARSGEASTSKVYTEVRHKQLAEQGITSRKCAVCGEEKPLGEFYTDRKICRSCGNKDLTRKDALVEKPAPTEEPTITPKFGEVEREYDPDTGKIKITKELIKSIAGPRQDPELSKQFAMTPDSRAEILLSHIELTIRRFSEHADPEHYNFIGGLTPECKKKITEAISKMETSVKFIKEIIEKGE